MKHIVGFSGGIDSQAVAGLILDKYNHDDVILLNSNAGGNEDPLTDEFVQWYSDNIFPVIRVHAIVADLWHTPNYLVKAQAKDTKLAGNLATVEDDQQVLTFQEMVRLKSRPPSRTNQFCTEILKLRPQRRWMSEHFGAGGQYEGVEYVRYVGVRRDESFKRRNTPDMTFDSFFDCDVYYPIALWTKPQCFEFVKKRGEKINPLYMIGFDRIGCMCCINAKKDDIKNCAERRPAMIDKMREQERVTGCSYFPPMVPGLHRNNIDEVLEWAKTDRGNKIASGELFEREACESKYGLCE